MDLRWRFYLRPRRLKLYIYGYVNRVRSISSEILEGLLPNLPGNLSNSFPDGIPVGNFIPLMRREFPMGWNGSHLGYEDRIAIDDAST